jgi:hypothetical protein
MYVRRIPQFLPLLHTCSWLRWNGRRRVIWAEGSPMDHDGVRKESFSRYPFKFAGSNQNLGL